MKSKQLVKQYRFENIAPSTTLKYMGVHKIQDSMDCDRLYFWKWILNLVPKRINIPFIFGTITHKAFELLADKRVTADILTAMDHKAKEELKGYLISSIEQDELDLQIEVAKTLISVFIDLFGNEFFRFSSLHTEKTFKIPLTMSPIILIGVIDAYGIEDKKLKLKEIKTSARITKEYFARLKFDKQINIYALGVESIEGRLPQSCNYAVIRKPQISVKQKETVKQFIKRLRNDLYSRPDFYFLCESINFGKYTVQSVMNDVEWATFSLFAKFNYFNIKQLLNPDCWPRNDTACFRYGTCPYFILCRNMQKYQLFFQLFRMREIRFKEEMEELNEQFIINTKPNTKIKG